MTDVDPLVGLEVGRYRVARLVGRGGMGSVYEGVQAESGAAVAIKVLSERYARDAGLIDRFFAEARATTAIAHENIIKVHDLALLPDGRPYIVMELLAGKTLRELVDDGAPLPIGGVINVVLEVLSALGATHAAGIVHRDIKPDNIFVTTKGRAKVLDFGIAKLSGANAVARTQTGVVLGTPEYMAPEQITDGTVDVRTDLYSLGIVLFEALTGKRPFEGKSDFELMRAHVSGQAPVPSALRADVPAALDDVVQVAMAKDPRDRFATTNAMATALHHVAMEITVEQWRSLVPGGRLMSPKPPSLPPPVEIPTSDQRATVRDVKHTAVTVSERPRAKPAPVATSRAVWWLVAGLAIAGALGGVIATQLPREATPVAATVTATPQPAPAPPPPPPVAEPDPIIEPAVEEEVPVIVANRRRGPKREAPPTRTVKTTTAIDAKNFDWRGYIKTAKALASEVADDVVWVAMSLDVQPDGRVDLTHGFGTTFYAFRTAKHGTRCEVRVLVGAKGPQVAQIEDTAYCRAKQIATPVCSLRYALARSKAPDQRRRNVLWVAEGWFVESARPHWIADDCNAPIDPLDLRHPTANAGMRARALAPDAELVRIETTVLDEDTFMIEHEYSSPKLHAKPRAARDSRVCIAVRRGVAEISHTENACTGEVIGVGLPRCTIEQVKARAKVKPDARGVVYRFTHRGWRVTIRQGSGDRDVVELADDC